MENFSKTIGGGAYDAYLGTRSTEPRMPGKQDILKKSQEKTRIIRKLFIELGKSGKSLGKNLFSLHIAFVNSCVVVHKVRVPFVVIKCALRTKHSAIANTCRLHIYSVPFSLRSFVNM